LKLNQTFILKSFCEDLLISVVFLRWYSKKLVKWLSKQVWRWSQTLKTHHVCEFVYWMKPCWHAKITC